MCPHQRNSPVLQKTGKLDWVLYILVNKANRSVLFLSCHTGTQINAARNIDLVLQTTYRSLFKLRQLFQIVNTALQAWYPDCCQARSANYKHLSLWQQHFLTCKSEMCCGRRRKTTEEHRPLNESSKAMKMQSKKEKKK